MRSDIKAGQAGCAFDFFKIKPGESPGLYP
jgi:hypothetical protein